MAHIQFKRHKIKAEAYQSAYSRDFKWFSGNIESRIIQGFCYLFVLTIFIVLGK